MTEPSVDDQKIYNGRLGRTSKTSVLISSHEGPVFPASVYTSVNVTRDGELRERLLEGTLNDIASPFSEETYKLAIPVRYHDEQLGLFALIIPEALRHEEFKHRSELLQELSREREVLPEYVRNFHTVFSVAQIAALEQATSSPTVVLPAIAAPAPAPVEPAAPVVSSSQIEKERAELETKYAELEEREGELTREHDELAMMRKQLDDVSVRLERERERMEEVEMNISTERGELEQERFQLRAMRDSLAAERQQLDALKLNLEQRELELKSGVVPEEEEKTQIVTDDQFITVVAEADEPEMLLDESEILDPASSVMTSAPSRAALLDEAPLYDDADGYGPDDATHITQIPSLGDVHVSSTFDEAKAGGKDYYVELAGARVVASWRATKKSVDRVLDANPSLFVQYALVEDCPLISLLLGVIDDEQQLADSFGWPLDISHDDDRAIIDALTRKVAVRFAFYDRKGKLLRTYDVTAPLEENAVYVRDRAEAARATAKGRFGQATTTFFSSDYERLGSMRHTFKEDSFTLLNSSSEVKLAAGIVGYWSTDDVYEYLVANRSFPAVHFSAIQQRVVEASLATGVYLNKPLRQIALDLHLVDNERALTRRLLANFAELSIGLKPNDLDPVEIWENWESLLNLSEEVGVQPDEDVLEFAQTSLRRAQEHQALEEGFVEETMIVAADEVAEPALPEPPKMPSPPKPPAPKLDASTRVDELVVAKRSENTGVTYYLPDDAVLDSFDDLATMPREDLVMLLGDGAGRLEAAQMLVERFGAPVLSDVLTASESMNASEIAALAKFLESRADGFEGELVRCVEAGGPSATYICAHALVHIKSTSAIPVLLEALGDPKRHGNRAALVSVLAGYGDKLVGQLTRDIKRSGHDDVIIELLVAIERSGKPVLQQLNKDRNRKIREAAKEARKRLNK